MSKTRTPRPTTALRVLVPLVSAWLAPMSVAQTLYETDFSTLDGWTVTNTSGSCGFAADATPADACAAPFVSAPASLNFNDGVHFACGVQNPRAVSPVIDLSRASSTSATLTFFGYFDTHDPGWDGASVFVASSVTGANLGFVSVHGCGWDLYELDLDPAWGEVRLIVSVWWDGIPGPGAGLFIDDLSVVGADPSFEINCVGDTSAQTGGRVYLLPSGSQRAADNSFSLVGAEFPASSFTQAFYGASAGSIHYGSGTRCIAAPHSFRLGVLPTGAFGRPRWDLDLDRPASFSVPILAGSTWYFQSVYRDGPEFRFSDSIAVTFE